MGQVGEDAGQAHIKPLEENVWMQIRPQAAVLTPIGQFGTEYGVDTGRNKVPSIVNFIDWVD